MQENETSDEKETVISKELADAIDQPLMMVARVQCDNYTTSADNNCIDPQLKPRGGKRKGWHEIKPQLMCASCACYWHLSCARNFALGVVR